MDKRTLLSKYEYEEFSKLNVDEQVKFINNCLKVDITYEELEVVFKCSSSTFLSKIRNEYKKKRGTNLFIKKASSEILSESKDIIDSKKELSKIKKELKNELEDELLNLKQEIILLKEIYNNTQINDDTNLIANIKKQNFNKTNVTLKHYKLDKDIATQFDQFCENEIVNKQLLLSLAIQEFLDKYNIKNS